MYISLRITLAKCVASHRVAAPASTLLLITLIAMTLGVMTQVAKSAPNKTVYTSRHASPGGHIEVAIDDRPDRHYSAYLPGLTNISVNMVYDEQFGFHMGQIPVPSSAPKNGYCTVLIMSNGRELHNIRLRLWTIQPGQDT